MTIEEIYKLWEEDGEIDVGNLTGESVNIPKLHNKYYKLYVEENLKTRKRRQDLKDLMLLKEAYYKGEMDRDDLKEQGWEPFPKRLLKAEVAKYLEVDKDIVELSLRIGIQEEKVQYLESILKMVGNRSFHIKNAIEWEKFKVGA